MARRVPITTETDTLEMILLTQDTKRSSALLSTKESDIFISRILRGIYASMASVHRLWSLWKVMSRKLIAFCVCLVVYIMYCHLVELLILFFCFLINFNFMIMGVKEGNGKIYGTTLIYMISAFVPCWKLQIASSARELKVGIHLVFPIGWELCRVQKSRNGR